MIQRLELSAAHRARIAAEAGAAFPRECCGLIEGIYEGEIARVLALHPTANYCPDPGRFEIDPAAHLRLLRTLRGTGRDIIGCYHSHPGGRAEPSRRDGADMRGEGFVWVIAALAGPDTPVAFAAFDGGTFQALSLAEPDHA